MHTVVKILVWAAAILAGWTLLAVGSLAVMYAWGWLSPNRSERIRRLEERFERAAHRAPERRMRTGSR
jgi:hypothetical protein